MIGIVIDGGAVGMGDGLIYWFVTYCFFLTTWESGAALDSGGVRVIGHRFSSPPARPARPPGPQPRPRALARHRARRRGARAARRRRRRRGRPARRAAGGRHGARGPTVLELAERLGVSAQPAPTTTTWSSSAAGRPARGGGVRGVGGAAHGDGRAGGARRPGRQSSRIENYLGFPAGLSGADLARRAADQARRLGAELLTVQDAVGLASRAPSASSRSPAARRSSANASCSPRVSPTASSTRPGSTSSPARASTTARRSPRRAPARTSTSCIIGGANSAGQAAVFFAVRRQVTMLVRGASLDKSMSHYLIEQIAALAERRVRTGRSASRPRETTAASRR